MKLSELVEIENRTTPSLRAAEGILWHYRFSHISKQYLEQMAKTVPIFKKM